LDERRLEKPFPVEPKWEFDHDMKLEMPEPYFDASKFEHLAPLADKNFEKFAKFDEKFDARFEKAEMKAQE
jgi:hypothetical protein